MWIYVGSCCFLFPQAIFFHRIRKETDAGNKLNPPCGQFFCSRTDRLQLFVSHRVVAGQVHLICTVQDDDWGAKRGRVLFGKLWIFHCERKTNKLVISSIVRGSMVRRNLHHKISHNIENYLQWEKGFFFFFLSVDFTVWIVSLNECVFRHQSMPKVVHFMVFYFFSLPGKQLGVHAGSLSLLCSLPFRRPQRTLCFLMMSKIKNGKDNIHTL